MSTSDPDGLPAQVSPPRFALSTASPDAVRGVEVLALPVLPGPDGAGGTVVLGPGADAAGTALGLDLLDAVEALAGEPPPATAGVVTTVPVTGHDAIRRVLLVGIGEQRPGDFRRAGAALARAVHDTHAVASSVAVAGGDEALEAFVVGVMLGSFGFHWRSTGPSRRPVSRVVLAGHLAAAELDGVLRRAMAVGGAGWRSRVLAAVPANLKSPAWLADQGRALADEAGLDVTVWDEEELAKRGMGGLLGVGQASASPPRLLRLDYKPAKRARRAPRVVLVGKGITFDSGGLSIKPADSMRTMKRDMTGGGVVIAVMGALAAVGCPLRVTGLVAAAENAVGAASLRPGDVITHFGGRTTEVGNTDAEGRLVLADALAYAVAELDPAVVVDVATLTGAVRVALGTTTGGLFATDDALADRLLTAGRDAGEPLWRLPLVSDYEDKLSSTVADADNAAAGPGAVLAALFLRPFVGGVPWAHLDIASAAEAAEDSFEWSAGPTGFGARALLTWLGSPDPLAGSAGESGVRGLTVRWSLVDAPPEVVRALADYVADTSHARFTGQPGLAFKTWRMRPGEWFEGCYVFATAADREAFETGFRASAAESPGSRIVGSPPVVIEPCEVVAVAEGGAGFAPAARA